MTTSDSKGRFFLQNESIRIDSHNETNRIDSNRELECSTTYTDNVALPAFARRCCSNQLISPVCRAHSNKPATRCCSGRITDRWTEGRTPDGHRTVS